MCVIFIASQRNLYVKVLHCRHLSCSIAVECDRGFFSHSNLKVLLGLFCPVTIFCLEFKSREELLLQPQTAAEHENDLNDSSSSSSSSGTDSSSDSDFSSDYDLQDV